MSLIRHHGIYLFMIAGLSTVIGCRSDASFAIERRLPARIPLPGLETIATTAFVGSAGDQLAASVARALARDEALKLVPDRLDAAAAARAANAEDDAALAKLARAAGVDGVVTGRVQTLDVSRTLESPTLVTKRVNSQPQDVPTVRRLKTGRLSVQFRVVLADGRVVRGTAIDKDFRAERTEDPMPHLYTLEPKEYPHDVIPSDSELVTQLADEAAADIVRDLTPHREPVVVTWENAGGADAEARALFGQHQFAQAAEKLGDLLGESRVGATAKPKAQLSVEETAAAHYDLGLCWDALGDYAQADRHLDHALTLVDSERHLATLRDLRRRAESLRTGGGR